MRIWSAILASALMLCIATAQEQKGGFLPLQVEITKNPEDVDAIRRDAEDLKAQKSMAVGWLQLGAALAGTAVAAVGTYYLIQSVTLSRQATEAAVEATKVARDALGAERAWITMGSRTEVSFQKGIELAGLGLTLTNSGRSPALKMKGRGQILIADNPQDLPEPVHEIASFRRGARPDARPKFCSWLVGRGNMEECECRTEISQAVWACRIRGHL